MISLQFLIIIAYKSCVFNVFCSCFFVLFFHSYDIFCQKDSIVIFDNIMHLLQQHFHLIFFQPVIHLQQVCKQLRSRHELAVERSAVVGGLADVVEYFIQVDQLPQRRTRVGQCLDDRGAQQVFVGGIVCLGIGALAAVQNLAGEQSVRGGAQQPFDHAVFAFHVPGDVPQVFHDAVVGERDARLEPGVHACAVHAVEKRLHKPLEIQVGNFPPAFFFGVFALENRNF